MITHTAAFLGALALASYGTAQAQWITPIEDWPAHYTDGPFVFQVDAQPETREHECMPEIRKLADAAYAEMERHGLATAAGEEARVFFQVVIIVMKENSRCIVFTRPAIITEIQASGGGKTVELGRLGAALITGSKRDTERLAADAMRDFVAEAGRGVLIARLRRAEATSGR